MKAFLLIDFGSTYTKLTAVDMESERLLGTAAAYTTVQTDINDGLKPDWRFWSKRPASFLLKNAMPAPPPRADCG